MASTNLALERGSRKNAPQNTVIEAFSVQYDFPMSETDPRPLISGPALNGGTGRAMVRCKAW